jgi:uncharacterized protein (DUF486 family)
MSEEYLKYIPNLFANPSTNAIALTFIPAIFYVLAAYGHLFVHGAGLFISILMSIFFATMEYMVRVPIIQYSSKNAGMSNTTMQLVWVLITICLSSVSDLFMTTKK